MAGFAQIREALQFIDSHLDEELSIESVAARYHFSPYYFHRMFTVIVGKSLAAHIRDRRLLRACMQLRDSGQSVLSIALACGYQSAQSFSRAFQSACGLSPSAYRKQGVAPVVTTAEELIMKFTNRLKGGIIVKPNIIKKDALRIAGVRGDGARTGEVWQRFIALSEGKPLTNKRSDSGYEVRLYENGTCAVHVGNLVAKGAVDPAYSVMELPASTYASFDVYVANGYDSENNAMDEWLAANEEGYAERLLGGAHYCVEFYDERFNGSEAGSIVEIWVPVEKK
jgi:AraC-like DNA-binding protein/predicted transcriptional regulator YdeE